MQLTNLSNTIKFNSESKVLQIITGIIQIKGRGSYKRADTGDNSMKKQRSKYLSKAVTSTNAFVQIKQTPSKIRQILPHKPMKTQY